jgi:hypothetical protein
MMQGPAAILPFEEMAERIRKIDPEEFAGAVVIVPHEGEPIAFLTIDPQPTLMQFWAMVKTRVERGIEAMQLAANQQDQWGQRR